MRISAEKARDNAFKKYKKSTQKDSLPRLKKHIFDRIVEASEEGELKTEAFMVLRHFKDLQTELIINELSEEGFKVKTERVTNPEILKKCVDGTPIRFLISW